MAISEACRQAIRLSMTQGLGLRAFYLLYDQAGSLDNIFAQKWKNDPPSSTYQRLLNQALSPSSDAAQHAYLERLERWLEDDVSCSAVCIEDAAYPALLKQIYCPPPVIYLKGNVQHLRSPSLAIVGSRKPTVTGLKNAQAFAQSATRAGIMVVSGMAMGIDATAHRAALTNGGKTCAVWGTGLDIVYPRKHISMAEEIAANGLLVSEMKLGTPPRPQHFPRRNRLISGLSMGVLVVEAGLKSGSLTTAFHALEQNRNVFAMPGAIGNLLSKGTHLLIKQGAYLVDEIEDILEHYESVLEDVAHSVPDAFDEPDIDEVQRRVLSSMGDDIVDVDELSARVPGSTANLLSQLVNLELNDLVAKVPGGYQRIKRLNS